MRKIYALNEGTVLIHKNGARYIIQGGTDSKIILTLDGRTALYPKRHIAMMLMGGTLKIEGEV